MVQKDMKKLVAYSSVSHLGFVMLGMFALNPPGLDGSVLQMINHGLSTGALFLLVGMIYERRHTAEIARVRRPRRSVMPVYATVFLIITLSSIGLPLLNGFIGEFMILVGRVRARTWWWAFCGGARASCSARPTCCGCTSASSSARSTTRRTRTSRT